MHGYPTRLKKGRQFWWFAILWHPSLRLLCRRCVVPQISNDSHTEPERACHPLLKEPAARQLDILSISSPRSPSLLVARCSTLRPLRCYPYRESRYLSCESKARSRDAPAHPSPITKLKSALAYLRLPHFVSALPHHLLLARSTEQSNVGEMSASKPDLSDLWIQHQRKNTKTTKSWACIFCPNRRVFGTEPDLWEHAKRDHVEQVEARTGDLDAFREEYAAESAQKRLVAIALGKAAPTASLGGLLRIHYSPRLLRIN
jgi:hypothetical protein